MTANNGPAALTRPGPDTEGTASMHEPTYLVPRHLLFDVQAKHDVAHKAARHLSDAVRDGAKTWRIAELRDALNAANLAYHCAILLAAEAGATSKELIGYGVSRDLAAELDRRARQ